MSDFIREYLEAEVKLRRDVGRRGDWHYSCPADLVLREGHDMAPTVYDSDTWGPRGVKQRCYWNAYLLAVGNPDYLRYVEGYATGVFPTFHAWCVDMDGTVVDPTWTGEPDRPEPHGYRGIVFPTALILDRSPFRPFLDDWRNDWPLLHQPLLEVVS